MRNQKLSITTFENKKCVKTYLLLNSRLSDFLNVNLAADEKQKQPIFL